MSDDRIYLSIISDDYGICEAINDGAARGFTEGLVTDVAMIANGPAFAHGIELVKRHDIPVGVHLTFTAEWDRLRWKPITRCSSMTDAQGYFFPTVEQAWREPHVPEVEDEIVAQWERIESEGIRLHHVSEHMGTDDEGMFITLVRSRVRETRVPHRGFLIQAARYGIPHRRWGSIYESSGKSTDLGIARDKLKEWLFGLTPGYHVWVCHCAVDHPMLAEMCSPNHPNVDWARTYRVNDLSLTLDPEVRGWLEQLGIERVPVSAVPVDGF